MAWVRPRKGGDNTLWNPSMCVALEAFLAVSRRVALSNSGGNVNMAAHVCLAVRWQ